MTGYTKLFGSIITSTIWREPQATKIVWITMLALSNKDGVVEGSIPGLAALSDVSLEEAQEAINRMLSPDKWSRTKEYEGRRIKEIDGGWVLLNHAKYRDKLSADARREYNKLKKREERQRQSTTVNDKSAESAHTDTDTDTDKKEYNAQQTQKGMLDPSDPAKSPRKAPSHKTSDEDFIASLKSNPAYMTFDIDRELAKMDAWLSTPRGRGRKKTRSFIVNWLSRLEAPVGLKNVAAPKQSSPETILAHLLGGGWPTVSDMTLFKEFSKESKELLKSKLDPRRYEELSKMESL